MRLLAAFVLLFAGVTEAQPTGERPRPGGTAPSGTLAGRVLDADGALVGATVALYASDTPAGAFVTGTSVGDDGTFHVQGVPVGTYRARMSFVGYAAVERAGVAVRAGETTDLGTVVLEPDGSLGEVEVTAQRELVEQRADRTVYNVAAQPVTAGGSALEALETLPSIEVDTDGTLSLRGGQNVAVQINGRPVPVSGAQLAALLRQIPAQTVDRVEVIPNPSAQYEPDGMSGIVNLVLRQNTGRGLSGGATFGGGTAPSAEAGGNVAYQRGPWDASGSYGYRYNRFGMDGTSTQVQFLGAGDAAVDQTFGFRNGVGSHLLNGSLDYTVAEGTTVGARGTLGFRGGTADQDVAYVFGPGTAGAAYRTRVTDGDVGGLTADAALTARRERGPGRRLSAEARWTRNDDDRDERFADAALGAASPSVAWSRASDLVDEGSVHVDAARALGGLQVEAGAKGTRRDIGTARTFSRGDAGAADPGRSGAFSYDESVGAVYAQASRGLGSFQFQAGLRAESAWRNVAPGGGQAPIEDRYASLYPSAFALYTASPGTTVKASTSRRVNRPQAMFLNPTPRFQDTLTVDVGNPTLRPEYTMAYELALQYRYVLTVTPFYRHTTDVIRRRIVFDPATGASTGTFQNLDTQDSYGADLTLTPRIGPVRGLLSASVYRSITDGGSVETGLASDGLAYTLRGNLQAEVRPGTTVQVFAFYRGPLETEDGRISPFGIASLGISHKAGERLQLSARFNDALGTAGFSFESGTDEYRLVGARTPQARHASATLTYTFGQQRPAAPPQAPQPPQGSLDGTGF